MAKTIIRTIKKAIAFWCIACELMYLDDYENVTVNYSKATVIYLERGEC